MRPVFRRGFGFARLMCAYSCERSRGLLLAVEVIVGVFSCGRDGGASK